MLLSNTPPVARRLTRKNWTWLAHCFPADRAGESKCITIWRRGGLDIQQSEKQAFETAQMGACSRDELSYIRSTTRVVLPSAGASTGHLSGRSTSHLRKSRTEGMNRAAHSAKWDGPPQGGAAFQTCVLRGTPVQKERKKTPALFPAGSN